MTASSHKRLIQSGSGDFLVQRYTMIKKRLKKPSKKFPDLDPDVDDF